MEVTRRRLFAGALLLLAGGATLPASAAGFWPERPVKLIVPYPPGGALDGVVRSFARALQDRWGQPVVIDNKPGANEGIAVQALLAAPADGYTLLAATDSALVLNPLLNPALSYQPERDLVPITQLVDVPMVLVVPADSGARDVAGLVRLAQEASRNRRDLHYGSTGVGGALHLAMRNFAAMHQVDMTHVPYKGSAELLHDLGAGRVDAAMVGAISALPFLAGKRVRVLGVDGKQRLPLLPDVPTFAESGQADFGARFYIGLVARKGTDAGIVETVSRSAAAVARNPEFRRKSLEPTGMVGVGSTAAEFEDLLRKDRAARQPQLRDFKGELR